MVPVLATPTRLRRSETQTLEHCSLLLEGIIVALASAEAVLEILVVLVVRVGLLGVYAATGVGLAVGAQAARACGGDARGAAVASEVALLEDLDEGMLAMTLDGAGVADSCWGPGIRGSLGGRVAC